MIRFTIVVIIFGLSMQYYDESADSLQKNDIPGLSRWVSGLAIIFLLFRWSCFHGGKGINGEIGSLFDLWGNHERKNEGSSNNTDTTSSDSGDSGVSGD